MREFIYFCNGDIIDKLSKSMKRSIIILLLLSVINCDCVVAQDYSNLSKTALFQKAEKGYAEAQLMIGISYCSGRNGFVIDYPEAMEWLKKAAEHGKLLAYYYIGMYYYYGIGVDENIVEAENYISKALPTIKTLAENGDSEAQSNYGLCYLEGISVSKNYKQAVMWFRESAEQGNAGGECNLAYCYITGKGVSQNYSEAFIWYKKAGEQGDAISQFNVGVCYEKGFGVNKNKSEAIKWYKKSASKGFENAKEKLDRLGIEY